MAENTYTEVTTKSFGQNIKNSFGGIIVGLIIFVISIVVLWCNEGNLARQNKIANYINNNAIPVESSIIDNANDSKLISTSGKAITNESLTDGIITVPNALALKRTVEMYQWEENEETESKTNMGGSTTETTTYSYEKVWSDKPIDSSKFHKTSYTNPQMTLQSERYNAKNGEFGAFKLSETQTLSMHDLSDYTNLPWSSKYKIVGNYYYQGQNMDSPSIGDIRISYSYKQSNSPISVIGMQRSDKTITPMISKDGKIYIQYDGLLSQAEMVEKFKKGNILLTNIFRFIGFILMFIGLNMILRPLAVLLSFIPVFERIVSIISGGIVFLVSLVLSLLVIAIAWLFYRPVLAICILALVAALVIFIKNKIQAK